MAHGSMAHIFVEHFAFQLLRATFNKIVFSIFAMTPKYFQMENSDQIRNKLEIITEKYPRNVVKSLSEGDLIQQGWSNLFYEIDDPEIYCKIGQFPAGMVPYSSIFHAIDGTFIGPKYSHIEAMGDKIQAKKMMKEFVKK